MIDGLAIASNKEELRLEDPNKSLPLSFDPRSFRNGFPLPTDGGGPPHSPELVNEPPAGLVNDIRGWGVAEGLGGARKQIAKLDLYFGILTNPNFMEAIHSGISKVKGDLGGGRDSPPTSSAHNESLSQEITMPISSSSTTSSSKQSSNKRTVTEISNKCYGGRMKTRSSGGGVGGGKVVEGSVVSGEVLIVLCFRRLRFNECRSNGMKFVSRWSREG